VTVEVKPVSTSQVSQMQELIYAVLPDVEQMANVSLSISEAIFLSLRMLAFVMMVGLENYANSIPVLERAARAMANALQQVIKMLYVYAMMDSQEKAVRIAVMVSAKAPIHMAVPHKLQEL
jgi:ethanolamine transporter EutH